MKDKSLTNIFKGDKVVWMIFFILCIVSVIEVYSASSMLSSKSGNYWAPAIGHGVKLLMGLGALAVVANCECKYFKMLTPFLLFGSWLMLLWVLVFGDSVNGANRWLSFMGIQFQPSEIAKGALVLATAQILSAMQTDHGADRKAFRYILMLSAVIIIPIGLENLSTAILLFTTVFLMMFLGRVPLDQLGKLLGVIGLVVALLFSVVMIGGSDEADDSGNKQKLTEQAQNASGEKSEKKTVSLFHRLVTWKSRIKNFFRDVPADEVDLQGKDAQKGYAAIAIASSNVMGKGIGKSTERDRLPQPYSDFIYAIIIEEMGILGAGGVAVLYIILLFRAGIIASRCENAFPAYLAMGLAVMFVIQALFNMLVAVGLAPVTGQPLPLISRGGTSTIINCVYIGMILSVSRSAKKKKMPATAGHGWAV